MDVELAEMPFLRNVGLLMTYKCQVACPHCIIEAGPHRTEEVTVDDAFEWIRQIAGFRGGYIKVVSLTGGEPFYNIGTLRTVSEFAASRGLFVSAVTNAFWACTQKEALAILQGLPAIQMLSISADVYHQMFIPLERVRNAITAAEACDVPYTVAVCTDNEDDAGYRDMLDRLREMTEKDNILTAITFPAGRALKKTGLLKYETSKTPPLSACGAGSSPIVFPDGRVIACIGPVIDLTSPHPLDLGSLREGSLQEILDRAEANTVLHAIRIWGPRRLISLAEEAGLGEHLPRLYVKDSVCHACYHLMANGSIVEFLDDLARDPEFRRKVAYARVHYLKETGMPQSLRQVSGVSEPLAAQI